MRGKADNHLPPRSRAHYFTRNRTGGSDFPLIHCACQVPTIVRRSFHVRCWPRERMALGRSTGTIACEGPLFLLAVCLCDHVASSTSYQVHPGHWYTYDSALAFPGRP